MPGGPIKIKINIMGHKVLMQKLRADKTLAEPMRAAYDRIGTIGIAAARGAAPVGPSGNTRSMLTYRVMGKSIATAVSFRTAAKRSSPKRRNFPYPKRVEYDQKSRHRHWLTNAIKGIMGRVQSELRHAERGIMTRWQT